MEGIHTLKDLLRKGDWLAKIDLKGTFFSIPIHLSHKKFLRFIFKEKTYQFNCLPFGLSSASWVFTKTLKPALAILRERGVHLKAYIDDILILAESRELILDHVTGMRYLLECLGFIVNTKKSVLNPAQVIEFLGLFVDSIAMEIRLPPIKIKQIRAESCKLARQETVSARMLAQLLGKMNATNCVLPPGPLFYRHLQMALTNILGQSSQCYKAQVLLTQECLEELEWWDNNMCRWNGKILIQGDIDLIDSDASLEGWGACYSKQRTGGPTGTLDAYQLSRTACSNSSNQNLCKVQDCNIHLIEDRQHHSGSLYQQPGRNRLQGIGDACKRSLDVVPEEEYPHCSSAFTRCSEHNS